MLTLQRDGSPDIGVCRVLWSGLRLVREEGCNWAEVWRARIPVRMRTLQFALGEQAGDSGVQAAGSDKKRTKARVRKGAEKESQAVEVVGRDDTRHSAVETDCT